MTDFQDSTTMPPTMPQDPDDEWSECFEKKKLKTNLTLLANTGNPDGSRSKRTPSGSKTKRSIQRNVTLPASPLRCVSFYSYPLGNCHYHRHYTARPCWRKCQYWCCAVLCLEMGAIGTQFDPFVDIHLPLPKVLPLLHHCTTACCLFCTLVQGKGTST